MQASLSWFVDAYARLAEWKATVDRLTGFYHAIERARTQAPSNIVVTQGCEERETIGLENVRLELPDGRVLLDEANQNFVRGEAVLMTGPSGMGKSTLFRAIAGIWPFGAGRITLPGRARLLFLPQKPYLPIGRLRDAMCYPETGTRFDDDALRAVLIDCALSHLADRLDQRRNWALELSVGEQQRIAFCRAFLLKPEWLMLDEATSALDAAAESRLYQLLKERLPDTTVISIGHRATLAAFHDRRIELWSRIKPADIRVTAA